MRKADAIKHFGTGMELAKQLKIKRQSVYLWPDVVPMKRALEIEKITNGKLKMVKSMY